VLLLDNPIQNYSWGSRTRLAELLGRAPTGKPEAELWIGAHPGAPSRCADGRSLLELIVADPVGMLGTQTQQRFGGELPFLLKVLAVEKPLSLQAHPDQEQARAGFAREQAAGIPLTARERTYKDPHHKPELLCALSRFEALSGFRPAQSSNALFRSLGLGEQAFVKDLSSPVAEPLRAAFSRLMSLSGGARTRLLQDVLASAERASQTPGPFQRSLAWAAELGRIFPGDVGAVASLLLNHITLAPFEALYLDAGSLHAYLQGTAVEIMANSDNVLRGGLTPKHVDVPELLRVLRFDSPSLGPVRTAPDAGQIEYLSPAPEFRLGRIELTQVSARTFLVSGPELLLCVEGQASLRGRASAEPQPLERGQSCFIPARTGAYELSGVGRLFRARVGCLQ
jgi:mannose-6-phosphate isomerase